MTNLLEVKNVKKHFPIRSGLLMRQTGTVHAVNGISFDLKKGETLGLVGESGCGKSTIGRTIIDIYKQTEGEINFDGRPTDNMQGKDKMAFRRNIQMIFQDPYSSLNPRKTIANIIGQPMRVHGFSQQKVKQRVSELLVKVGLGTWAQNRYPHEFSGGQRQRIAIARAMGLSPKLVICDEPVSALDVSVQSQILNLMQDLKEEMGMSYLFIAHDLAVVKHMSDRIAVMYLGNVVELSTRAELFKHPRHPYTQALMGANPVPGAGRKKRERTLLQGDVPSPINPPPGCTFHPRCLYATEQCKKEIPSLRNVGSESDPNYVACHLVKSAKDYPGLKR